MGTIHVSSKSWEGFDLAWRADADYAGFAFDVKPALKGRDTVTVGQVDEIALRQRLW
jgi:hypothetical protein